MFRNYLTVTLRNLWKHKIFSAINILGLSIGLACCVLIFLLITHELSYDKFNVNAANIYRLTSVAEGPDGLTNLAVTPAPWGPLMKKDYPEIKNYVRILKPDKSLVGVKGEEHFYENDLLFCDSTFFDVFSFQLLRGDKQALYKPNSVILTKEMANKYFPRDATNVIGKTIELSSFGRDLQLEVTGIVNDAPANSHFTFSALVSMQTLGDLSTLWSFHMFQTYLLLNNGVSTAALESKYPGFVKKYILNNPAADGKQEIHLQPLTDIHLHSQMTGELGENGDITYVYVFTGIALFILLIACFNFTNLSTARSIARAKEVGLRKVIGAQRKQLMWQFLGESVLVAVVALIVAVIIVAAVLPFFNQLAQTNLKVGAGNTLQVAGFLLLLVVFAGILSGIYPAAVLSSFRPVEVLKGKFQRSLQGLSARKFLVTLQFAISIILISGTILIYQQLKFMQEKKLGFEKNDMMIISLPRSADSSTLAGFKSSLLKNPAVSSVAAASNVPGIFIPVNQVNTSDNNSANAVSMQMLFTDEAFIKTMQMQVIAGRDFSKDLVTDQTEGFIVNEEAVKKLGWKDPQQAIGKRFQWVQPNVVLKSGKIIGVVKNFNITPLKSPVQPLVMHILPQRLQFLYVRFKPQSVQQITTIAGSDFKQFFPTLAFEYSFLDDKLNSMYSSEKRLGEIVGYFSALAILIACLGILGLSIYSIQQRVKEIGIRKILGANVAGITTEISKEFLKPVFVAALVACPVAWYGMHKWLENFAYRITIEWWVFLVAGTIALLIALLTVSTQAIKAATANPVKALRTE
ncbi:MAG TPA: ABC transporter permease [Parafilimonas sp.]|nr:ABC transporter permease [Parafilimonas sp.]